MNIGKEFVKPTIVLTLICLVITALLSATYEITQPIIKANASAQAEAARTEVLSEADSFQEEKGTYPEGVVDVYSATNKSGYTITVVSKGYASDPLKVMVGIKADGTIEKIKVLNNAETPGLGSKVSATEFVDQFPGMDNSMSGFQMVSGATVSSTAMKKAVEMAFQVYSIVKGV